MNLFTRFKDKLDKILCGWPLYLTALKITGTCTVKKLSKTGAVDWLIEI